MKRLTFEREDGTWYICLPNWIGLKRNLMMVAGADVLLDNIASLLQADTDEYLKISMEVETADNREDLEEYPPTLIYQKEDSSLLGGANYKLAKEAECLKFPSNIWLCPVTLFVYGQYPKWFGINILTVVPEKK